MVLILQQQHMQAYPLAVLLPLGNDSTKKRSANQSLGLAIGPAW